MLPLTSQYASQTSVFAQLTLAVRVVGRLGFVAEATAQGYRVEGGRTPFHGYYFKILTKQGPAAPGGALDYVVGGKMIGGFGLVAYPAEYRNSGVKTFVCSHSGTVFERDLGPNTAKLAERMSAYNPDKTWTEVKDTDPVK